MTGSIQNIAGSMPVQDDVVRAVESRTPIAPIDSKRIPKGKDISIESAANGYIVRVGCQTLVFESRENLFANLGAYLANPEGMETKFWENEILQRK